LRILTLRILTLTGLIVLGFVVGELGGGRVGHHRDHVFEVPEAAGEAHQAVAPQPGCR